MLALQDAVELIEHYYQNGWTADRPVIPPSETSINAMLAQIGLGKDDVVGGIRARNVKV